VAENSSKYSNRSSTRVLDGTVEQYTGIKEIEQKEGVFKALGLKRGELLCLMK